MNRTTIATLALCLISNLSQAQNPVETLKIEYQTLSDGMVSNAHLYINPTEAYYTVNYDDTATEVLGESIDGMGIISKPLHLKYSRQNDSLYQIAAMKSVYPQGVLIAEKRKAIDWGFVDSTQEIKGYLCKLAKGSFRGREFCAWYSLDIDATEIGPWKLHGLPGAIIYAYDTEGFISWKLVDVTYLKKEEGLKMPEEPKLPVVSREEYRAWRASAFKKLENREAPKGLTYDIKITTDYLEKE